MSVSCLHARCAACFIVTDLSKSQPKKKEKKQINFSSSLKASAHSPFKFQEHHSSRKVLHFASCGSLSTHLPEPSLCCLARLPVSLTSYILSLVRYPLLHFLSVTSCIALALYMHHLYQQPRCPSSLPPRPQPDTFSTPSRKFQERSSFTPPISCNPSSEQAREAKNTPMRPRLHLLVVDLCTV